MCEEKYSYYSFCKCEVNKKFEKCDKPNNYPKKLISTTTGNRTIWKEVDDTSVEICLKDTGKDS